MLLDPLHAKLHAQLHAQILLHAPLHANYMLNYMLNYMPLHAAQSYYMFHYMPITCSITWFITWYSTTYHYMHCMAWDFLSPWSRVSSASFHSQGVLLLKHWWCSSQSLLAATIDEGLAREDPPQLPQTWKHRAEVSNNNETRNRISFSGGLRPAESRPSQNEKWNGGTHPSRQIKSAGIPTAY